MFCSLSHTYYPLPVPLPIYVLLCLSVTGIFLIMTINALSGVGISGGHHPSRYSASSLSSRDLNSPDHTLQQQLTGLTVSAVLAAAEKYCETLPSNPALGIWSGDGKAWFEWLNGRKKAEGCVPSEGLCIAAVRAAVGADAAKHTPKQMFQGMKEERVKDGCGSLLVWT
ncbi:MAG: hypothetical protein Q9227_005035 [Pyrenula ochraceoflavens]